MENSVPTRFENYPNVLRMQQLKREHLDFIFSSIDQQSRTDSLIEKPLDGKCVGIYFGDHSAKTFLQCTFAVQRLGGTVLSNDHVLEGSQAYPGERIDAVVEIIASNRDLDLLILRLPKNWLKIALSIANVPIINAMAKRDQHLLQTLSDLHFIRKRRGELNGLRLLVTGDLQSPSAQSLLYALCNYDGISITGVAPDNRRLPSGLVAHLEENGVEVNLIYDRSDITSFAPEHDGVYVVRAHRNEDLTDFDLHEVVEFCRPYSIRQSVLDALPNNGFVLHPLPWTDLEVPLVVRNEKTNDSRFGGKLCAKEAATTSGTDTKLALLRWLLEKDPVGK